MTTIDRDYQAKARAAMELAAAATSDTDRLEWLRVALAWHNLVHASGCAGEHLGLPRPGHVIDDNNQRIDTGWRVKRAGQMHRDHRQTNSDGGSPRRWTAQFHNKQSNKRREKVTADKGPRLCRLCLW
jgi:hypothetical protein